MATPPPPPPPPELSAAAKRISALEADVANLRRGMVQQLTSTGKLVQIALAIDEAHFGGRHLAGRQPNPQEELAIATEILASASQELEKGTGGKAPVAQPAVTEVLRSELVARESELGELRRQTATLQEEAAQAMAELQARVEQAEERAAEAERQAVQLRASTDNSDDERRSDRAEALGLCAELMRLLQANPAGGDDVQITLQVLQDALTEDPALGTVCQATESATVAWGAALTKELQEAKAQLAGVEALRTTAGEWQKQAAQLKAELERSRGEAAKAVADAQSVGERSAIIEREITKLQAERESLLRDVERLQVELGEQRRTTHEANMARTREHQETEAIRSKVKDDVQSATAAAKAEIAAAKVACEAAIAERDQIAGRMSNAQERIDRLEADRERSASELANLNREVEMMRQERETALGRVAVVQERIDAAASEREKAVAEREKALAESIQTARDLAAAQGERDAAQGALAELKKQAEATAAERDRATQEVNNLKRDLDATRAEREAAAAKTAAVSERHDAAASDRDRLKGELAELRRELESVRAVAERTAGERDTIRSRILAADGAAEAAIRERDAMRNQLAGAQQERDRFRQAMEQAQHEHSALARAKDEMSTGLNLRLTETSRQLGELKQVQTRLASENDRLQAELAKLSGVVERGRTDVVEAAKRAEAEALSRAEGALAESRQEALAAERRATDAARRAEAIAQAVQERDAQLAQLAAEVKRLGDQTAAARGAIEAVKSNAYEEKQALVRLIRDAKAAVENAKREMEKGR